jgi:hypothetical protein
MGHVSPGLPKRNPGLKLANAFSVNLKLREVFLDFSGTVGYLLCSKDTPPSFKGVGLSFTFQIFQGDFRSFNNHEKWLSVYYEALAMLPT